MNLFTRFALWLSRGDNATTLTAFVCGPALLVIVVMGWVAS